MNPYMEPFNQRKSFEKSIRAALGTLDTATKTLIKLEYEGVFQRVREEPNSKLLYVIISEPRTVPFLYGRSRKANSLEVEFQVKVAFLPANELVAAQIMRLIVEKFQEGLGFPFWETNGSEDPADWTALSSGVVLDNSSTTAYHQGEYKFLTGRSITVLFPRRYYTS